MLTLKTSVAAVIVACTAAVSAGAGFVASRAAMTTEVSVTCPAPTPAPVLRHSLESGPVPDLNAGKKW